MPAEFEDDLERSDSATDNPWSMPTDRRKAIALGLAAGSALSCTSSLSAALADRPKPAERSEQPFDNGWLFLRGEAAGAEQPSFDDSGWRAVELPHDWSIEDLPDPSPGDASTITSPVLWSDPGPVPARIGPFDKDNSPGGAATAHTIGGEGWYRKYFETPELAPDQKLEIRFDGVFQNADIWLNGSHVAFHPYGYTPIIADLTSKLSRSGPNVLAVRVRNLGDTSRWYSGSGITRHVWLMVSNPVHIPLWGMTVTTPVATSDTATVTLAVTVANGSARATTAQVHVELLDPHQKSVAQGRSHPVPVAAGGRQTVNMEIRVPDPALWSLDAPHLHIARATILVDGAVADVSTATFGIRSITLSGATGFLLNGEPLKLRGANIHQDLGPLGGVALEQGERRRIEILKSAGFNAIRTAHQPPSPGFLDACDRLGMLVIVEMFDMWDGAKNADDYHSYFKQWFERDVEATVRRDRNHPSVILWSIGNEVAAGPDVKFGDDIAFPGTQGYGRRIAERIRAEDPTRKIVQGGAMGISTLFTVKADSPVWDYLDLGDVHYQHDYHALRAGHPEMAFIQSESFPATLYKDWMLVRDNVFAIGDFTWAGWDYLGEAAIGAPALSDIGDPPRDVGSPPSALPYPWIGAYCGDFDLIGQPKAQYYYRKVVWGDSPLEVAVERPVPAGKEQRAEMWSFYDELPSWTWNVPRGQMMKVRSYTSGDHIAVRLNGRLLQTVTVEPDDKLIATVNVPYEPGVLTIVALRDGKQIARRDLVTVGEPARFRLHADVDRLDHKPGGLAHVTIEVVDAQDRLVPDAVLPISVEVSGPGYLAGIGNGNPRGVASFQQPATHAFHGRALAIIRYSGPDRGLTRLVARSEGLAPAMIAI